MSFIERTMLQSVEVLYTPVTHLFSAIYRAPCPSTYTWYGAHLVGQIFLNVGWAMKKTLVGWVI